MLGFVHVALSDGDGNPLLSSKSFAALQDGASEPQDSPVRTTGRAADDLHTQASCRPPTAL